MDLLAGQTHLTEVARSQKFDIKLHERTVGSYL